MPIPEHIKRIRAKVGNDLIMVPGASAVVINDTGEILLHRRSDNGEWALPAGVIEPGEEPGETAIREVFEETGVHVKIERVLGVYGGADHMVTYPNGDQVAVISVVFLCRPIGGTPQVNDDESLEVRYFAPNAMPQMVTRYQMRVEQALKGQPEAHYRLPKRD